MAGNHEFVFDFKRSVGMKSTLECSSSFNFLMVVTDITRPSLLLLLYIDSLAKLFSTQARWSRGKTTEFNAWGPKVTEAMNSTSRVVEGSYDSPFGLYTSPAASL